MKKEKKQQIDEIDEYLNLLNFIKGTIACFLITKLSRDIRKIKNKKK